MTRSPGDGAVADTHKPNSQQFLQDPETGGFLAGTFGSGRKVGARAKIDEEFVSALRDDFLEHGVEVIVTARKQSPLGYLRVIAHLLPPAHAGSRLP